MQIQYFVTYHKRESKRKYDEYIEIDLKGGLKKGTL